MEICNPCGSILPRTGMYIEQTTLTKKMLYQSWGEIQMITNSYA